MGTTKSKDHIDHSDHSDRSQCMGSMPPAAHSGGAAEQPDTDRYVVDSWHPSRCFADVVDRIKNHTSVVVVSRPDDADGCVAAHALVDGVRRANEIQQNGHAVDYAVFGSHVPMRDSMATSDPSVDSEQLVVVFDTDRGEASVVVDETGTLCLATKVTATVPHTLQCDPLDDAEYGGMGNRGIFVNKQKGSHSTFVRALADSYTKTKQVDIVQAELAAWNRSWGHLMGTSGEDGSMVACASSMSDIRTAAHSEGRKKRSDTKHQPHGKHTGKHHDWNHGGGGKERIAHSPYLRNMLEIVSLETYVDAIRCGGTVTFQTTALKDHWFARIIAVFAVLFAQSPQVVHSLKYGGIASSTFFFTDMTADPELRSMSLRLMKKLSRVDNLGEAIRICRECGDDFFTKWIECYVYIQSHVSDVTSLVVASQERSVDMLVFMCKRDRQIESWDRLDEWKLYIAELGEDVESRTEQLKQLFSDRTWERDEHWPLIVKMLDASDAATTSIDADHQVDTFNRRMACRFGVLSLITGLVWKNPIGAQGTSRIICFLEVGHNNLSEPSTRVSEFKLLRKAMGGDGAHKWMYDMMGNAKDSDITHHLAHTVYRYIRDLSRVPGILKSTWETRQVEHANVLVLRGSGMHNKLCNWRALVTIFEGSTDTQTSNIDVISAGTGKSANNTNGDELHTAHSYNTTELARVIRSIHAQESPGIHHDVNSGGMEHIVHSSGRGDQYDYEGNQLLSTQYMHAGQVIDDNGEDQEYDSDEDPMIGNWSREEWDTWNRRGKMSFDEFNEYMDGFSKNYDGESAKQGDSD